MRVSEIGGMKCPVARTLSIVGDPWTLLILRELFLGSRRFEEFEGYTGMSPALLSSRLRQLAREGILERRVYRQRPRRHEYRLTEKGLDLYPLILALSQWGSRWMPDESGPLLELEHEGCGAHVAPRLTCPKCGEPVTARDIRARPRPAMKRDRERSLDRFRGRVRGERRLSSPRGGDGRGH